MCRLDMKDIIGAATVVECLQHVQECVMSNSLVALFLCIHVYIGVSRGPRLFDPRVCDDKTYITTLGMQQTFAHGRTT